MNKATIVVFLLFAAIGAITVVVFHIDVVGAATSFISNPTEYISALPQTIGETIGNYWQVIVSAFGGFATTLMFVSNQYNKMKAASKETEQKLQGTIGQLSSTNKELQKQHEKDVKKIETLQNADDSPLQSQLTEAQQLVVQQRDQIKRLQIEKAAVSNELEKLKVKERIVVK